MPILLEDKKDGRLPPDQETLLQVLKHEADTLTLRRSYAAVLLKRRGLHPGQPRGQ